MDTAKKYGVKVAHDFNGNIVKHMYPYFGEEDKVATKTRLTLSKGFAWSGMAGEASLFGQQLFREGGKFITLTEGECDAMAAYELLGSKFRLDVDEYDNLFVLIRTSMVEKPLAE